MTSFMQWHHSCKNNASVFCIFCKWSKLEPGKAWDWDEFIFHLLDATLLHILDELLVKAKLQHRRVRHFISPVVRKPQRIYVHAYFLTQLSIVVQAVVSFDLSSRSAFVSHLPRPSWKEERESGVLYCVSRHMGQGLLCVKCHNCIFIWNLIFLCSRLRHCYYGYQKLSWEQNFQNTTVNTKSAWWCHI